MRKVIVCTHGNFGEELIKSAEMIVGPLPNFKGYSLLPTMDQEDFAKQIEKDISPNEEVICLVDIFFGSPAISMAALSQKYNLKIISGVNLPMLLELSNVDDVIGVSEVTERLIKAVQESSIDVLAFLNKRKGD